MRMSCIFLFLGICIYFPILAKHSLPIWAHCWNDQLFGCLGVCRHVSVSNHCKTQTTNLSTLLKWHGLSTFSAWRHVHLLQIIFKHKLLVLAHCINEKVLYCVLFLGICIYFPILAKHILSILAHCWNDKLFRCLRCVDMYLSQS